MPSSTGSAQVATAGLKPRPRPKKHQRRPDRQRGMVLRKATQQEMQDAVVRAILEEDGVPASHHLQTYSFPVDPWQDGACDDSARPGTPDSSIDGADDELTGNSGAWSTSTSRSTSRSSSFDNGSSPNGNRLKVGSLDSQDSSDSISSRDSSFTDDSTGDGLTSASDPRRSDDTLSGTPGDSDAFSDAFFDSGSSSNHSQLEDMFFSHNRNAEDPSTVVEWFATPRSGRHMKRHARHKTSGGRRRSPAEKLADKRALAARRKRELAQFKEFVMSAVHSTDVDPSTDVGRLAQMARKSPPVPIPAAETRQPLRRIHQIIH